MLNLASVFSLTCLAALRLGVLSSPASYSADDVLLMDRLVKSYPGFLAGDDGNHLIWKDGTRMEFDDGKPAGNCDDLLENPSLKDMFYAPYTTGAVKEPPNINEDPDRVRSEEFFLKTYGDGQTPEWHFMPWLTVRSLPTSSGFTGGLLD